MPPAGAETASLQRILVALLVGLLIGLERERAEERKTHRIFAGVRTFPLIALVGACGMLLLPAAGPAVLVVGLLAVGAVALASYLRASAAGDLGATTEIAALGTYLLGATAGAGQLLVAGATGVAVAVLLAAKPRLEAFSHALTQEELVAVLELAVISAIVLPLLPDRGFGPWRVVNPFEAWLMVVLVSAVSFAGFVAMRLWGRKRGLILAAVIGGVASSTAVTVAMAGRVRETPAVGRNAATATVLASTIMCARIATLSAMVGPGILPRLWPVLGAMALAGLAAAMILGTARDPEEDGRAAALRNPFRLGTALAFGLLYALVRLGVRAAEETWGQTAVLATAALSSVADVDAISIAMARGGPGVHGWRDPAAAVAVGAVASTLVKLGIAAIVGRGRFRVQVAIALAAMAACGIASALFVFRHFSGPG